MIIGRREFDTEHNTYIMGILNVTPDSFRMEDVLIRWMQPFFMQKR